MKKIAGLILVSILLTGCSQSAAPQAGSSPSSSTSLESATPAVGPAGLYGQCFAFFQTLEAFKGNTATQYISVQGGSTEQALEVLKGISVEALTVRDALWSLRASLNLYEPENETYERGVTGVLGALKTFEPTITKFVNIETVTVDELTETLGTIELLTNCAGLPQV